MSSNADSKPKSTGKSIQVTVNEKQFSIPPPRSIAKFIIYPSLWSVPCFRNTGALIRRIKTNFLYFQTNYLILTLCLFALFMILSMKTLLTGVVSSIVIAVAVLFFFEHIPLARQIKQNHPVFVSVLAIVLFLVAWYAFHTILIVIGALMVPLPLWLLHATFRSTNGLIDGADLGGNYFANTPVGQIMQMLGFEANACSRE